MSVELISTVFYEDEPKVDVIVRDGKGNIRRVELTLIMKDDIVLPVDWMDRVQAEIDYQDAEEENRLKGRSIPF